MSGLSKRRAADIERLERLCAQSGGELRILRSPENRTNRFEFQLSLPTAGSSAYPAQVQPVTRFQVDLPARYPFEAPTARMAGTPIHHPNVFESGVICVGSKWNPSEGLDLYVRRLCQLLTFDGMLVNMNSVAHAVAGHWYANALKNHPSAFPTAHIRWDKPADKVVRTCPDCRTKLRLPTGRSGTVTCPRCSHEFQART